MFLIRLKKTTADVVLLFHFDFLSGTDTIFDAVQFAQFLNGCSVACCYFRKGITILDGYTLAALFFCFCLVCCSLLREKLLWRL